MSDARPRHRMYTARNRVLQKVICPDNSTDFPDWNPKILSNFQYVVYILWFSLRLTSLLINNFSRNMRQNNLQNYVIFFLNI